jgi:Tfp pilus assembly protein PilX
MRPRTKKGSDGLAMIMVLVMIIIFASLILAVVISSTTAIRRAHYYKDKSTALEVAEAGLQDALYWMNYKGYDSGNCYPCTSLETGTYGQYDEHIRYFRGSNYPPLSDPTATDTWTATEPTDYNPTGVQGARCVVEFSDEDETDTANLDTITSTGHHKGRTAKISVRIRGQNGEGNPEHIGRALNNFYYDGGWHERLATWGVPEDFNKHTVFTAKNVTAGTPENVTITGNISYQEEPLPPFTPGEWTKNMPFYPVDVNNMVRVETSIYIPELPIPSTSTIDATYDDTGFYPYPYEMDPDGAGPAPQATVSASKFFEFTNGDTVIVPIEILGEALFDETMVIRDYVKVNGNATFQGNAAVEHDVVVNGNATIKGSAKVTSLIDASGTITITESAKFLYGTKVGVNGSGITISSANVQIETGLFHSTSNISINCANTTENSFVGTFYAESGTSHFGGGCRIGTETNPALIVTEGITTFVNLEGMTLNGTVYSQGRIWIGNADNTITADKNTGVALILDRAAVGENGTIVTNTTNDTITGLIYARGGDSTGGDSTVSLNNDTVTGAVVCDGTVQYTGTVNHYFDKENFEKIPQVYKNFKGGRRRYLPVPGSLEIEW